MNDTSKALVEEIQNLRIKLGKSIEADVKDGSKALASQQKKTVALRKKVTTATTRLAKARAAAKTRPTDANKAKVVKLRDDLASLKVDLKAANDAKREINAGIATAKDLLREHKTVERAIFAAQRELAKAAKKKGQAKRKAAGKKAVTKKIVAKKEPTTTASKPVAGKRKTAVKRKATPKVATVQTE